MKIFGITGWSGSGKTTLLERVIPLILRQGIRVSTIKHTHHDVDLDHPGKDSFRHRAAGAVEVMVASAQRWALLHENRQEPEPEMDALIRHMTPVDLLLVEGFKRYPHPKLEVYRPSLGRPPMFGNDPEITAIASDQPLSGAVLPLSLSATFPVFDLNDSAAIAAFIMTHSGLCPATQGLM